MANLGLLLHLVYTILTLLIAWIIVSIPIWLASKFVSKRSSLGKALVATMVSYIIFFIVFSVFSIFNVIIAFLLGFFAILAVFRVIFDVSWTGALLIAIIAFLLVLIISFLMEILFSIPILFHGVLIQRILIS
jgi:hypothetical protein